MFQPFNNKQLTSEQSLKYLKKILENVTANPHSFFSQLQSHPNIQSIYNYLSTHSKIGLEIILSSLSIQQSLRFMKGDIQNSKILSLLSRVCRNNISNKCTKLAKLSIKYSSIEKQLVILKCISEYSVNQCQPANLCSFLPLFIRMEAFIIEKYLKIKNQPSKNAEDYIQSDLVIVKECEKWAGNALIKTFNNLPILDASFNEQKKILLRCLSDVYAAILEALNQNNLSKDNLYSILDSANRYMFKSFSIQSIHNQFMIQLRSNKYVTSFSKLQIKQNYTIDNKINSIGYCYWTFIYLQSSIIQDNIKLNYFIPSLCQIISKPYEFKQKVQNQVLKLLSQPKRIINGFQWNYPIQLMLFYLNYYNKDFYNKIKQKIIFDNKKLHINTLNTLKCINIQGINLQKQEFILQMINQYQLFMQKSIKIVLRNYKFQENNQKNQDLLTKVIEKYIQHNGKQNAKQLIPWGSLNKQNKQALQKLILD